MNDLLRHWLQRIRPRIGISAFLVLLLLGAYALFLWTLPPARVYVVLAADSQFVRFQVIDPAFATLRLRGMKAEATGDGLSGCVDAIVTPSQGAWIEYRRGSKTYFRVTLDPPHGGGPTLTFVQGDDETKQFFGSVVFSASDECSGAITEQLPLWGPASFGSALKAPGADGTIAPWSLTKGSISTYARAHERLVGIPFPRSIYLVSSFEIPPGSIVMPEAGSAAAPWIGSVTVNSGGHGFNIQAVSEGGKIRLKMAGFKDSELIDLGDYSQFLKDPNILEIQFLVSAFLILFNVLARGLSYVEKTLFSKDTEGEWT